MPSFAVLQSSGAEALVPRGGVVAPLDAAADVGGAVAVAAAEDGPALSE